MAEVEAGQGVAVVVVSSLALGVPVQDGVQLLLGDAHLLQYRRVQHVRRGRVAVRVSRLRRVRQSPYVQHGLRGQRVRNAWVRRVRRMVVSGHRMHAGKHGRRWKLEWRVSRETETLLCEAGMAKRVRL